MDGDPDLDKKDVRRPMNAFLIFCKRHRAMVRERNPHLDNRSVTRILGDLWANIGEEEKVQYTDLAKQYKDAFMRANPDYKWHNPERMNQSNQVPGVAKPTTKLTNERTSTVGACLSGDGNPIVLGKLADPSNMGGLSLLMEGNQVKSQQFMMSKEPAQTNKTVISPGAVGREEVYQWQTQQGIDLVGDKKFAVDEKVVKMEEHLGAAQNLSVKQTVKMECVEPSQHPPLEVHSNQEKSAVEADNSIYSCGKHVMDHIINKLYLTIPNVEGNQIAMTGLPPMDTGAKFQEPVETSQKVSSTKFIPPSQGKKSYHTSIAVRNLLEFTRKAAAQHEEANMKSASASQMMVPKVENETHFMSETKQRLKDFCLKKESRPKAVNTKPHPEPCGVKEFKRKRCYSESIAEFYKSQEKRIKIEADQFDNNGGENKMSKDEDYQPTRKSRRRNRGQKYQELINEGIIQPSKARLAAMKTDTSFKGINFKESFFGRRAEELGDDVLSVYPRQIRKRTMSESEKNRTSFDESARYRTGDFDLEAHIKTLPACSIDKVVKPKRMIGRTSSESEPSNIGLDILSSKSGAKEVKLAVPPRIKVKCSEVVPPVVGSRKRKARKHSITHLQPIKTDTSPEVAATLLSGIIPKRLSTEKLAEDTSPVIEEICEKTETIKTSKSPQCDKLFNSEQVMADHSRLNSKAAERLVCLDENFYRMNVKKSTGSSESETCSDDNRTEYGCSDSENVYCKVGNEKGLCDVKKSSATKIAENAVSVKSITNISERVGSNIHFTRLKDCQCEDEEMKDVDIKESVKILASASTSCANSDEEKQTVDQDENLNETDYVCKIKTESPTTIVSCKEEISDLSDEVRRSLCDKENFTKVTAVSVAVPISKEETNLSGDREPEVLQMTVSSVSDCSSAVAMTTMQPSLTCLC